MSWIYAEKEKDGAPGDGVQQLRHDASRELPDPEQAEVEQRGLRPPLEEEEGDEGDEAYRDQALDDGVLCAAVCGECKRQKKGTDRCRERREPLPVHRRSTLEGCYLPQPSVSPEGSEDADRDVDVEECAPIQVGKDQPAESQPEHRAQPVRDLVYSQGEAQLVDGGRVSYQGGTVCEEDSRAESLNHSEDDHMLGRQRETRQSRADRE